jgi:hypothetical protein
MLTFAVVIGGGWVVVVADLAHGTVALEAVARGIGVEMGCLSAVPTRYLIVTGWIRDVRMVVFVGSHDGRLPRMRDQRNGGTIRVCWTRIVEVVEMPTLAGGIRRRKVNKNL